MTYTFGPFRYDASQRLLFRDGELIGLAPKALETLHVLLERRGRIVEKSELMQLVWPGTHVEEVGLARNISLLRKALGGDSEESAYIETVPRRGYRFCAEVGTGEPASAPDPAPAPEPPARKGRRWWLWAACIAAAAAFVYYEFYVPSPYVPGNRSAGLAVIPFECLCPGMDGAGFPAGLDAVLTAEVSKLDNVQTISPSTVGRYRRAGVSMAMMGRVLGLDVLLEGTIQEVSDRLQITARLVDVRTGRVIWAETYDRSSNDPAEAQRTVAGAIAAELGKRLNQAASP